MASIRPSVPDSSNNGTQKTEMDPKLVELMDRLKAKAVQLKSWTETTKVVRMAMSDKRHLSEVVDKVYLQKCLDHLQKAMKVTTQSSIVEKLNSIARSTGLKFTAVSSGTDCYISTESFYVEIKMETNGKIKEVNVSHGNESKACPELVKVLKEGNFDEFTEHLEGLGAIYKIGGDKKQKTKSYVALQSLETDLNQLSQLQNSISGVSNYIHKSPLGIVQPRVGGLPMKLIYFVAPYNLLNPKTKTSYPMTVEAILDNKLGHSVTVGIESSFGHRLQTMRLMTISKTADGKNLPSFPQLSTQNSSMLCACFVLNLQTPIPVSLSILQRIQQVTGIEFIEGAIMQPIVSLIADDMSKGKMKYDQEKGLRVTLKDQDHVYHLSEPGDTNHMVGMMISKIQFTHPTHVPKILIYLRQQLVFNTFITSCIRPHARQDVENAMVFEVMPVSLHHISVAFEHPVLDSMASVEFDLNDMTNVKAKLMALSSDNPICQDEFICKVIQRCLSIPVTMRMIMTKARAQLESETQAAEANAMLNRPPMPTPTPLERRFSFPDGTGFPPLQRQMSYPQGVGPLQSMPIPNFPHESSMMQMGQAGFNVTPTNLSSFDYESYTGSLDGQVPQKEVLESIRAEKVAKNPMLASLLDQDNDSPETQATLLPNLLADNPHNQQPLVPKPRKPRKRKATSDARSPGSSSGKSPKRKFSEEEFSGYSRQMSSDLPSLPMIGSVESNDLFELPMHDMQQMRASVSQLSTPTTPIDQPSYHTESHVTKLASSLDNIIKQETKNLPSCQQGELAALLSDNTEEEKPLKKSSEVSHPPKVLDTPAVVASTSGAESTSTINIADIQAKNDPLGQTLDDIINNVASGTTPLDPEIFTNKEGMVYIGGQLVGPEGALRPATMTADETKGIVRQASLPSQDFDTDPLEFNTELLNTEGTFPETLNENSEEMDLEACDANAFGVTLNPAVVASKLTASGSTPPTLTSQSTPTTVATVTSTASAPPVATLTTTASVALATNTEVRVISPQVEKKPEKEKKEYKEKEKVKEKKDGTSKDEKSKKSVPKPLLTVKIGSETTHTPSPQEVLDLSTCTKEQKVVKSKLTKQAAVDSDEDHDRPTYTSASTGSGNSIVISTKSSPALSSSGSSSVSASAKIISSKDNLLKMSVKKDKLKRPKDLKEEDLKHRKDGSKKDKYSKKRKLDETGKMSDSTYQVKNSSSSKSKLEHKPSTKIKITTTGGRMHVQPANKTPPATDAASKPKSMVPQKTSPSLKPVKSGEKNPPLQLKIPSSKISSHGSSTKVTKKYTTAQNITVSKGDSKLMNKTPTIKLKPLRIPSSASNSTFTVSTKSATPTTSTTTKSSPGLQKTLSTSSKFYGQKTPNTPPLSKISSSVSPVTNTNPLKRPETAKLDISKLPKIPKLDPSKKKDLTPTTTKSVLPVPPKPSTLSSSGVGGNNSSGGPKKSHGIADIMASNPSDKQKTETFHNAEKPRTNFDQVKKVPTVPSQKPSITLSSSSDQCSDSKPSDPRLVDPRLAMPYLKPKEKESPPQPEPVSSKNTPKEEPKEPEKVIEKAAPSGRSTPESRTQGRNTPDGRRTPDNNLKDKIVKDNNNKTPVPPIIEKEVITDLETTAKQIFGEKSEYFKQPPPKSNKSVVEPKPRVERTGPVQSPRSAPSSPEDSLFIDCPTTPGSRDTGRSPVPSAVAPAVSGTKSPAVPLEKRYSPVPPKSPASHDSPLVKKSQLTPSPMAMSPKVMKPITSPISNPSPCMIDDDLMDEAVMGLGD
ncbi:mediator of RNA polymerase II transcription subunit 1-like isoform X2 [Lineus longissimus]|uniref:mediator of RNA polymerase II transcription subunit 1-like isoform X2 n=1 Tax=Lineus longissimus TaxID=88925 RepID=UPI002B4D5C64